MKKWLNKIALLLVMTFSSLELLAQDAKKLDVNVDINKGDSSWYQQPWVWVVGGAVFILLIVALARGGGKKE